MSPRINPGARFFMIHETPAHNFSMYGTAYDICRKCADIFGIKFPFNMYDQLMQIAPSKEMTNPDVGLRVVRMI